MSEINSPAYSQFPRGRINFGWISEAWRLVFACPSVWITIAALEMGTYVAISAALHHFFPLTSPPIKAPGIPGLLAQVYQFMGASPAASNFDSYVIGPLTTSFFSSCAMGLAVRQVRGETIAMSDLFKGAARYPQMLLFNVIFQIAVTLGVCACCVGSIAVSGLLLPGPAMVADGRSAFEALNDSIVAMKREWLAASVFIVVVGLVCLAGALVFFVGTLITGPMIYIVSALAYRDMVIPRSILPGYTQTGNPGDWPPPPSDPGTVS